MYRKFTFFFLVVVTTVFYSCQQPKETDDALKSRATELAKKFTIVDGHIDLPDLLKEKKFLVGVHSNDTLISTGKGEFDYTRAIKGGLDAPFMSIYIPLEYQDKPDFGAALADSLINQVVAITQQLPDKFALANTPAEIDANTKAGKISLPMGMENGAPIGNDIAKLKYFFDRGIRYITLTHNKDNQICDASRDSTHTWQGLSAYGEQVVQEMNRLGIMVDISHVDDSTFYDVMKLTNVPVIASHSSCRAFAPTVMRDMTDDMIRELGKNKGVIMINFYTAFLDSVVVNNNMKLERLLKQRNLKSTDASAKEVIADFNRTHPMPTNVETVVDHIDHVVQLAGIDHVGIGSDFDGVSSNLPTGLEDVSTYPNLIAALLKRGYSESDIEKICSGNIIRVWKDVIAAAEKNQ